MKGTVSNPKSGGALANATVVTGQDRREIPTTHLDQWTNVTKASPKDRPS